MKKISNKGFMLAETLIVTVFVMGMFVMIYRNSVPLISEYSKLNNYDDLNVVYDLNLVKEMLFRDDEIDSVLSEVDSNGYKDMSNCNNYSNHELCSYVKNVVNVSSSDRIIITKWDPTIIKEKIDNGSYLSENGNRGIKEYISYVVTSYNKDIEYDYRIIISVTENDTSKYANLGVIYE